MRRPRLTRGQWRVLLLLDYVAARYGSNETRGLAPSGVSFGSPVVALLRHGYVEQAGLGYRVTDAGARRVRRADVP